MSAAVRARVDAIIAAQLAEGRRMQGDAYFTDLSTRHNVGIDVSGAANVARNCVEAVAASGVSEPIAFVREVSRRLRELKDEYAEAIEDPDGYGAATFHEIQAALAALLEELGG